MSKRFFILFYMALTINFNFVLGQISAQKIDGHKNIPQERLFMHFNSSLAFPGEYIYFKLYSLNASTNRLSGISRIAYVELVGEDKNTLLKYKVRLKKGMGSGDFFIPPSVSSGNYKLIAYTQWMRNTGELNFFRADIRIINPYQENQTTILKKNDTVGVNGKLSVNGIAKEVSFSGSTSATSLLNLKTNKSVYSKREQVVLTIKSIKGFGRFGECSISVKRVDSIGRSKMPTTTTFFNLYNDDAIEQSGLAYLPEMRGEHISGKVMNLNAGEPGKGVKVAISVPGEEYEIKVVKTDTLGTFLAVLEKEYKGDNIIIQVLGPNRVEYKIEVDEHSSFDYENLVFNKFYLMPEMEDYIVERSLYNQIENKFSTIKPDSVLVNTESVPFHGNTLKNYILEDYTRFRSIEEVMVELIEDVWITEDHGERYFRVRGYEHNKDLDMLPLVIVDGLLLQKHSDLIDFDIQKIESIGVKKGKYVLGAEIFKGVLEVKTKDRDFNKTEIGEFVKVLQLSKPIIEKKYFRQNYRIDDKEESDHVPDFRLQLLWQPYFKLENEEKILDFFTSDIPGKYQISLEGFTNEGQPISLTKIISVK